MEGFDELLLDWVVREQPSVQRYDAVKAWLMAHGEDPYPGMRREPAIPGLWYGRIIGTMAEDGTMIQCSYFIDDPNRHVKANGLGSINPPF
jgi:hypothetical protein